MSGPTLQDRLEHLTAALVEAERKSAAGEPYPDSTDGGSWPKKIAVIKKHIADLQEMIANE
jgi:hypothetical protein